MKCPNCDADLVAARRNGVDLELCPSCRGMWLSRQELDQLENKAFDLGDDHKGSLVFHPAPSTRTCPECARPLGRFQYRDYDLEMEFCEDGHGFWLDEGEDKRVRELMKQEEASLERAALAEDRWAAQLRHWRTPSFIDRLPDMIRAFNDKLRDILR